ncbi:chlorophyll synthase ChlG [Hyphomonas sp.]|uniref:chlorophyll synthase ChlG n=1 Tax=Hyphomonas sp. TaxID=87 RepID=UPI0039192CE0
MIQTPAPAASRGLPEPSAVLELFKPVTWFAAMWAFMCGAVSSGQPFIGNWHLVLGGMLLAGPMVCASSQAVNDWYDRHVDAINEPNRPIPSGRIPGQWGLYLAILWSGLSLLLGLALGFWAFCATLAAVFLAWAYSAPPLRLKLNGWWGNAAVGFSYEGIAWLTGAAVMLGALPNGLIFFLAIAYSIGAHGIMTLNDFKSIEGDTKMGVRSLPVQLGPDRAARLACIVMALPQMAVILMLIIIGKPLHAAGVLALLGAQVWLMRPLLADPRAKAIWYSATGVTLYVLGMLISAFAVAPWSAA